MSSDMRKNYLSYFKDIDDINPFLLVTLVDPMYKLKYFTFILEKLLGYEKDVAKIKSVNLIEFVVTLNDLYATRGDQSSNTSNKIMEYGNDRDCSRQLSGKRALVLEDLARDLEDRNAPIIYHELLLNLLLISTGKRVIDPQRSSLTPTSVEALICIQNWLKSDSITSLEYALTLEEIEFFENVEAKLEQETKQKQKEDVAAKKNKTSKGKKGGDGASGSKTKV